MIMEQKYQRKNYLPDKPNQFRFAFVVITYILAYTVMIYAGVFYFIFAEFGDQAEDVIERAAAMEAFSFMTQHFPLPFLAAAALIILHSLYFSHRIFGPVVQLRRVREKVELGDFSQRVQMRKKDILRDVEYNLNGVLETCEERIKSIRQMNDENARLVRQLTEAATESEKDAAEKDLIRNQAELSQYLSNLKTS